MAQILIDRPTIQHLKFYLLGTRFFELWAKAYLNNEAVIPTVTTLRIENIVLDRADQLSAVMNALSTMKNLRKLKLGTIWIAKNNMESMYIPAFSGMMIEALKSLPHLRAIHIRGYTDNSILKHIASQYRYQLETLCVASPLIDDDGVGEILQHCVGLHRLDIPNCIKINGHCFNDAACFQLQRLTVRFDEYKLQWLTHTLTELNFNQVVITNRKSEFLR